MPKKLAASQMPNPSGINIDVYFDPSRNKCHNLDLVSKQRRQGNTTNFAAHNANHAVSISIKVSARSRETPANNLESAIVIKKARWKNVLFLCHSNRGKGPSRGI
jgi:hypothetical protein